MKHYILLLSITLFFSFSCESQSKEKTTHTITIQDPSKLDTATFAGGCFWCVEAVFDRVKGVEEAVSGYSGGKKAQANYSAVSQGRSEHAEAVAIYFNPDVISYDDLLKIFFATHDATQLNRQGPDVGKQYRSEIFYHNAEQKKKTQHYIKEIQNTKQYSNPIVTKVTPFDAFYIAEDYHQNYYNNNHGDSYIRAVAKPKIDKFEKKFSNKLKPEYR